MLEREREKVGDREREFERKREREIERERKREKDSNSWRSFTLLNALAKSKGNLFA